MARSPNKTVAEGTIKRVVVKLDGKEWPLVVNHNVLIECEELTGMNMLSTGEASMFKPSAKLIRAMLYLCLKRAGAKYTLEEVGSMIGPHNLLMVGNALMAAWAASMPDKEDDANPTQAAMAN